MQDKHSADAREHEVALERVKVFIGRRDDDRRASAEERGRTSPRPEPVEPYAAPPVDREPVPRPEAADEAETAPEE